MHDLGLAEELLKFPFGQILDGPPGHMDMAPDTVGDGVDRNQQRDEQEQRDKASLHSASQ